MAFNINSLNDDCFLLILNRFTLDQHICVFRLVCHYWRDVIEKQCHYRTTLKLFPNNASLVEYRQALMDRNLQCYPELYEPNADSELVLSLNYSRFPNLVQIITKRLFSNVQKLIVGTFEINAFLLMNILDAFLDVNISGWNDNLKCLVLFGCATTQCRTALWERICGLPKLKSLHFVGVSLYSVDPKCMPLNLEQLSLCHNDLCDISKWTEGFAELKQLKQFTLLGPSSRYFEDILNLSWLQSLTHLGLDQVGPGMLQNICRKLTNLTSLDVRTTDKVTFPDLLSNLTLLPHLSTLRLINWNRSQMKFDQRNQLAGPYKIIRNISSLYLKSNFPIPELDRLLPTVFPRLEQLHLLCPTNAMTTKRIFKWIRGKTVGSERLSSMLRPNQIVLYSTSDVSCLMSAPNAARYNLRKMVKRYVSAQKTQMDKLNSAAIKEQLQRQVQLQVVPLEHTKPWVNPPPWKYKPFHHTELWVEEQKLRRELSNA